MMGFELGGRETEEGLFRGLDDLSNLGDVNSLDLCNLSTLTDLCLDEDLSFDFSLSKLDGQSETVISTVTGEYGTKT